MACSLHPGRREPSVCQGYHQRPCQLAHGLITWVAEVCIYLNILMPEQKAYTLLTAFWNLGLQKKIFEILLTQKPGKMIFDRNTALIYDSNPNEVISVPADVIKRWRSWAGNSTCYTVKRYAFCSWFDLFLRGLCLNCEGEKQYISFSGNFIYIHFCPNIKPIISRDVLLLPNHYFPGRV